MLVVASKCELPNIVDFNLNTLKYWLLNAKLLISKLSYCAAFNSEYSQTIHS